MEKTYSSKSAAPDGRLTVYCPECLVEYREGFLECADCRVPLKPGLPPPDPQPQPDLDTVVVWEGNDPLAVGFAKGTLEDAGIPFYVEGEETAIRIYSLSPLLNPWCRVMVARDREASARALFETLKEEGNP